MEFSCPKCLDRFRKQERFDKHVAKCKGKVCRNCGKIGHFACFDGKNKHCYNGHPVPDDYTGTACQAQVYGMLLTAVDVSRERLVN